MRATNILGALPAGTLVIAMLLMQHRPAALPAKSLHEAAKQATAAGDYSSAAKSGKAAAEAYRSEGDRSGESRALSDVGVALTYLGDYRGASEALGRALEISRGLRDEGNVAEQLNNLANVRYFQAQYADALQIYNEAIARLGRSGIPGAQRRLALLTSNLASLQQRVGNEDEALRLYRTIDAKKSGLRPYETGQLLVNIGVACRRLGDPRKAMQYYSEAQRIFASDHHLDGELSAIRSRGVVQALELGELEAAVRTFTEAHSAAQRAGAFRQATQAQLYRGEALYRLRNLNRAREDFVAALRSARTLHHLEEEWKALYGLGRISLRTGNEGEARRLLGEAVQVIETVREGIRYPALKRDFLADKRDVYDAILSLEVKTRSPAQVFAWIERSRARTFQDRIQLSSTPPNLSDVQARLPEGSIVLDYWDSSRGAAVVWIMKERSGLQRIDAHGLIGEAIVPEAAFRAQHIVVIPDGKLSGIPFEALQLGRKLLVETAAVSYVPSASVLMRTRPLRPVRDRFPWSPEIAAFADPVFGNDVLAGVAPRLPASGREVSAVAAALKGRSVIYTRDQARKAEFLAARAPVLHVATHAVADDRAPQSSRLLFSPGIGQRTAEYLFLDEVYGLDLRGTDLVALSACDTEQGRNITGEGVESFSRAFLAAGAQSTVTALWRVDDAATAAFMQDFYARLGSGASKADALRQTKLRFLYSRTWLADPKYWAGFVLAGDGFHPVFQPIGWVELICCGIASLLAVFACVLALRAVVRTRANDSSKTCSAERSSLSQ